MENQNAQAISIPSTSSESATTQPIPPFSAPNHQVSFNAHELAIKHQQQPNRSYTDNSVISIPALSITPSPSESPKLSFDNLIPSNRPLQIESNKKTKHHIKPLSAASLFSNSSKLNPSTLSPTSIPAPLATAPIYLNHRRNLSQPITIPIKVKESLNGFITEEGLEEGQRKLNQYKLLKIIGKGSFGKVELGQNINDQSLYAIKEYSKSRMRKLTKSSKFIRRKLNSTTSNHNNNLEMDGMDLVKVEVAIMKKLNHINLVSLIEVIDTNTDSIFFVLELCPYGPIKGPLNQKSTRNLFTQIILGIEYLHSNLILHRDIKPDNILYFEDPKLIENPICKIVDFGVSEIFINPNDDTTHKLAGSPAFLSPELCAFSSGATQGKPADIWAMGITLYYIIFDSLPFDATNPLSLANKIINDPLVLPPDTEPDLSDLLYSLLNKSPTERIEMESLKVHKWITLNGKEPLPSTKENVIKTIDLPTENEIQTAFKSLKSLSIILKAVSKLKSNTNLQKLRRIKSTESNQTTNQNQNHKLFLNYQNQDNDQDDLQQPILISSPSTLKFDSPPSTLKFDSPPSTLKFDSPPSTIQFDSPPNTFQNLLPSSSGHNDNDNDNDSILLNNSLNFQFSKNLNINADL